MDHRPGRCPSADRVTYGVPLTAEERDELLARAANADEIIEVIAAYGATQPDFAGVYTDNLASSTVAVLFTGRLADHAAAIGRLVRPGSVWEVRRARWTLAELQGFQARIEQEQDRLSDIGATYQGVGILIGENQLDLMVSSADPNAAQRIIEHFAAQEWLRVRSDGLGPWRGGYGSLEVTVVNADGTPVTDATCRPVADASSAYLSEDLYGTSEAGTCSYSKVGATGYTVRIDGDSPTGPVEIGSGRVTVPAGGVGRVRIVVNVRGAALVVREDWLDRTLGTARLGLIARINGELQILRDDFSGRLHHPWREVDAIASVGRTVRVITAGSELKVPRSSE